MLLSTLGIAVWCIVAPLEILQNLPLLCANRSPIRYGFGVDTKAILWRVHIALVDRQGAQFIFIQSTPFVHIFFTKLQEENATDARQINQNEHQGIHDEQQDKQGEGQGKEKEQQENQDGEQVDQDEQQYNQEDSNMADPVRLTAPDVHKDFTVRR